MFGSSMIFAKFMKDANGDVWEGLSCGVQLMFSAAETGRMVILVILRE